MARRYYRNSHQNRQGINGRSLFGIHEFFYPVQITRQSLPSVWNHQGWMHVPGWQHKSSAGPQLRPGREWENMFTFPGLPAPICTRIRPSSLLNFHQPMVHAHDSRYSYQLITESWFCFRPIIKTPLSLPMATTARKVAFLWPHNTVPAGLHFIVLCHRLVSLVQQWRRKGIRLENFVGW